MCMEFPIGGILGPGAHDFLKICGGGSGGGGGGNCGRRNLYCASERQTADARASSQHSQLDLCEKEFEIDSQ